MKTILACCLLFAVAFPLRAETTGTLTAIHRFTSAEGAASGGLIVGNDGFLYGVNEDGGPNPSGHGTVYRLARDGTVTVLQEFIDDGKYPGSLVQDGAGNLYGIAAEGGENGAGVVFKIRPDGELATLHSFASGGEDNAVEGGSPRSLLLSRDGNLYGTTSSGGAHGQGTVFKMSPVGVLTVLCSFDAGAAFSAPAFLYSFFTSFIEGQDGNLYGTTTYGGAQGSGTVFTVTPGGALRVLHDFNALDASQHNADGAVPNSGLCQGTDGSLYGATAEGGPNGFGTIYSISPAGGFRVLNTFDDYKGTVANYGLGPGSLIAGKDGNFYGVTRFGGATHLGTIFMVTTGGTLTILDSLNGSAGASPGSLAQDGDGNFYGLTEGGGTGVATGTAFALAVTTFLPTVSLTTDTPEVHVGGGETGEVIVSIPQAQTQKVIVHFKIGGSAVNGTDYEMLTGKAKIKPGKTSRAVPIAPMGTLDGAPKKVVKLTLLPGTDYTVGDEGRVKIKLLAAGQ